MKRRMPCIRASNHKGKRQYYKSDIQLLSEEYSPEFYNFHVNALRGCQAVLFVNFIFAQPPHFTGLNIPEISCNGDIALQVILSKCCDYKSIIQAQPLAKAFCKKSDGQNNHNCQNFTSPAYNTMAA